MAPRHIGLIGGIGPAATDFYYRRLIATFAAQALPLELTIVHADTATLLRHLQAGDVAGQVAIYARLTERLVNAGADGVAVTSIAGHFCSDGFAAVSPLPVIDMLSEVEQAIATRGLVRVGLLGTRTVMETRLYGRITTTELVAPPGALLGEVHAAYAAMAVAGVMTEAQRAVFDRAARALIADSGVDAIMLGGTDLALAFDERTAPFPLVDCAGIHADAIARWAIAADEVSPRSRSG